MKITDLGSAALQGLSTGSISSTPAIGAYGRGGRGGYGTSSDQVQLSGASRLASSALAAHNARLTQLKKLVASGEYNPSAEAISKSMVSEALSRGR
jgi:hypothetical protein